MSKIYFSAIASFLLLPVMALAQNVEFVGSIDLPDYTYSVYVSGNYAYLADGYAGLQIVDISDIPGHSIGSLVEGIKPVGEHQAIWDASGNPSGIYIYRIEAGDRVDTKRMVLLK